MDKPTFAKIRVLLADDDNQLTRRLSEHLKDHGFDVRVVTNAKEAKHSILEWKPKFVLADLVLQEGNAFELIEYTKQEKRLRHQTIHVIVMSAHNMEANVKQAFQRGAKDYVVKPFKFDDMLKRLVFHSRNYRGLVEVATKDLSKFDESGLMLHLTDLVLRQALGKGGLEEILFNLTRMVSLKVDGVRCNIVQTFDQKTGVVVTSNDDRGAAGIQLDLYKYPEILHVMNTGNLIAIEDIEESLELRHIKENMKDISFNSMIVCPISRRGENFGVLSLRLPPDKQVITDNEIRFVEIVAHVISLVFSSSLHQSDDNFWMNTPRAALLAFRRK